MEQGNDHVDFVAEIFKDGLVEFLWGSGQTFNDAIVKFLSGFARTFNDKIVQCVWDLIKYVTMK